MPAKSRAQQRFFGLCMHQPSHAKGKCPDMPRKEMQKFAATKHKALPEKVRRRKR
jgi:hypothetical protein